MSKYLIFVFLSITCMYTSIAQNDFIHEFPKVESPSYSLGIKSVGDEKAVIFVVDDYFTSFSENINTKIIKVDYDGEVITDEFVNLPDYYNITVFDAIYTDTSYIFMATVSDVATRNAYFVTMKSTKDLNDFSIIDKSPIDYPHFGLMYYNTIFNENTLTHDLVFTIGFGFYKERAAMYVAIDGQGNIQQLKVIDIDDHLLYDHYYNQALNRHYISSSSYVYELDEAFNLIKETNIFVKLGETSKFNFDQRILFASDTEIHLVGRWPDRRKPYIYKIKTYPDGTFDPILYDETFFPEARSYLLSKQYTKDKTIISYSTDLLDTDDNTPNTTFLWELGDNITKEHQYRIEDGTKKVLIITDIDEDGNMLGYGSEYGSNKSVFFILSEDNSFLVNNIEIDLPTKPNIYPNPTSHFINIDDATRFDKNVSLISISGHMHHLIIQESQIDVSTLSAGIYIIALTEATTGKVYRQKIIKID